MLDVDAALLYQEIILVWRVN